MKPDHLAQILLIGGLLGVTFSLFFFTVPPENRDLFQTCLTAIISFISGTAAGVGWAMRKEAKYDQVAVDQEPRAGKE